MMETDKGDGLPGDLRGGATSGMIAAMDAVRMTLSGLGSARARPSSRFGIRFGSFTEVMSMLAIAIGCGALVDRKSTRLNSSH